MKFLAKNYKNRKQLEEAIQFEVGGNITKNEDAGHTIEGTKEELKELRLSETTKVFGVKCVVSE